MLIARVHAGLTASCRALSPAPQGGRLGGSSKEHYDRYWMAFVTQAGVTLGLAQRVAGEVSQATSFGSSCLGFDLDP